MLAMEYAQLQNIDEVEPLDELDIVCLEEICQVLARHGRINRFGVALLHNHFSLQDGEMMVEFSDAQNRALVTKPMNSKNLDPSRFVQTLWRFDDVVGRQCVRECNKDASGYHNFYHDHR